MARVDRNQKKEKIATANVKGIGSCDVCYIGGSTMELQFSNGRTPVRFNINALDQLVANEQAVILSQSRYDAIKKTILPDGSTKTHNADGSLKSASDRALEMLIAEGHAEVGSDGTARTIDREEQKRRQAAAARQEQERKKQEEARAYANKSHSAQPEKRTNAVRITQDGADTSHVQQAQPVPVSMPTSEGDMSESGAAGQSMPGAVDASSPEVQGETTGPKNNMPRSGVEVPNIRESIKAHKEEQQAGRLAGDVNGDGVVDEFDDFVMEEQKKNLLVFGILTIFCCLSIFLFFFIHAITASLFHGAEIDLFPSAPVVEETPNEQQTMPSNGEVVAKSEQEGQQSDNNTGFETVVRTDYDPEDAVRQYQIADSAHQAAGLALIEHIRQAIYDGKPKSMWEAANLGHIADQVGEAYADYARKQQSLTLPAAEELRQYYRDTFDKQENSHVADKDIYGSIFGGRVREIRQNGEDEIFIVMESISGDHQRICFKAMANEQRQWEITNIMDAEGYVAMIAQGEL